MNWNLYLNFLAAMLAIVNPIGIWPIWSELTNDEASKIRKRVAIMVILTAYFILVIFLIGGKYLLQFFSIDLQVFKIAGGILLLYVGISMVQGSATQVRKSHIEGGTTKALAKQRFREIIVPIGIPALAGPGSITTVIVFGNQAGSPVDYLFLAGVIFYRVYCLILDKRRNCFMCGLFHRVGKIFQSSIIASATLSSKSSSSGLLSSLYLFGEKYRLSRVFKTSG